MKKLVLVTMLLAGCASGPGLGRVGMVQLASARPAGAVREVRGRDCTATLYGGHIRTISVEAALAHALERAHLPRETPVYDVESSTSGSPEVCIEVRGIVVAVAP